MQSYGSSRAAARTCSRRTQWLLSAAAISMALGGTFAHGQISLYWDGDGAGVVGGGNGTWDTTLARWSTMPTGTTYQAWVNANNDDAIFGTTAGLVIVGSSVSARSIAFDVDGYNLVGPGVITLGATGVSVATGTGSVLTAIAGTSGLTKTGAGNLFLGAANSFTGVVTVSSGTLSVNSDSNTAGTNTPLGVSPAVATPGAISLDGGAIRLTSTSFGGTGIAANRGIAIGAGGGTVNVPDVQQILSYNGIVTGTTLTKIGDGEFRMASTTGSTYAKLVVAGGLFRIGSGGLETNLGAVPGAFTADALTLNGGSFGWSDGGTVHANRGITLGSNGGTLAFSVAVTIPGAITGSTGGGLNKTLTNVGTLTSASNNYDGATNLYAGSLSVASTGAITNTSAVNFRGGILALANTTAANSNRINSADWNMDGGTGTMNNNATVGVTEVVGALNLNTGNNAIRLTATGSGVPITLTFSGALTRSDADNARASVLFAGSNIGTQALGSNGIAGVSFTNTASATGLLVGANNNTTYSATALDLSILPFAIGDTSGSSNGNNFVTYNASNGVQIFRAGNYDTAGFNANNNISFSATTAIGSNVQVNSVRFTGTAATALTLNADLTVFTGAILSNTAATNLLTIGGTGNLAFGSREAHISVTGGSIAINSTITGSGGLTKFGANPLTLGANNTGLSGQITVNQGTLIVANVGALGSGTIALRGAGASSATMVLANAGTTTISNNISLHSVVTGTTEIRQSTSSQFTTLSGLITGGNAGQVLRFNGPTDNTSGFLLSNTSNSFVGTVSLNQGTLAITSNSVLGDSGNALFLQIGNTASGGLRFDANNIVVPRRVLMSFSTIFDTQAFTAELSGPIGGIAGTAPTLTKLGTGTLILSGNNEFFAGPISVGNGKLVVSTNNALGSTLNGTTSGTGQASTVTLAFKSASSLNYTTPELLNIAGQGVGGVGALENLGGDNFFTGNMNINGGTTTVGMTAGSLRMRGTVAVGANSLFVIGAGNLTLDGVISGTSATNPTFGTITKQGSGVMTMSAANSYSGITRIQGGTLALVGSGAIASSPKIDIGASGNLDVRGLSSPFSLAAAQTLAGTGNVYGAVTANANSTIAPGGSIGLLTITDGVTLNDDSTLSIELDVTPLSSPGGSSDQLSVIGGVLLGDGMTPSTYPDLNFVFTPAALGAVSPNKTFIIVINDDTDAISGEFAGKADDVAVIDGLLQYVVDYNYSGSAENGTGTGNDIAVTFLSVPEPGTLAGVAASVAMLVRRRRR